MKEKPINLKAWEVRAILDGRKTQTRRLVKPQPMNGGTVEELAPGIGVWQCQVEQIAARPGVDSRFVGKIGCEDIRCPYCQHGDRLWVRETWAPCGDGVIYKADARNELGAIVAREHDSDTGRWHPSIHMPRWASRIDLEVVSVRVERLNDISEADAEREGIDPCRNDDYHGWRLANGEITLCPRHSYESAWESITGPGSWDANPFVWVVEFRRV